jgi:hypothetical protein
MLAEDVTIGVSVRYPRTGTTGKVVQLKEMDGQIFAELDSTGLLYRIDQLVGISKGEAREREEKKDLDEYMEKQKEFSKNLEEAWMTTDQSCEGGG